MTTMLRTATLCSAVSFFLLVGCKRQPDNSDSAKIEEDKWLTEKKRIEDEKRLADMKRQASLNLEYWNRFNSVKKKLEYTPGEGVDTGKDAPKLGDRACKDIESIPIKDVEPELVQLALQAANLCRKWGRFVDEHYSGSALAGRGVRGFLRGLTLNLKAASDEDRRIEEGRQILVNETNNLRIRASKLRLEMSTKYEQEFVAMGF
jgi:hypothetical protein